VDAAADTAGVGVGAERVDAVLAFAPVGVALHAEAGNRGALLVLSCATFSASVIRDTRSAARSAKL